MHFLIQIGLAWTFQVTTINSSNQLFGLNWIFIWRCIEHGVFTVVTVPDVFEWLYRACRLQMVSVLARVEYMVQTLRPSRGERLEQVVGLFVSGDEWVDGLRWGISKKHLLLGTLFFDKGRLTLFTLAWLLGWTTIIYLIQIDRVIVAKLPFNQVLVAQKLGLLL